MHARHTAVSYVMDRMLLAILLGLKRRIRLLVDRIRASERGEVRFHSDPTDQTIDTTSRDLITDKVELKSVRGQRRRMTEESVIESHARSGPAPPFTLTFSMSVGTSQLTCQNAVVAVERVQRLQRSGAQFIVIRDKTGATITLEELVKLSQGH